MQGTRGELRAGGGLRSVWIVTGSVSVLLHRPLDSWALLALAVPWLAVMILLLRTRTSARLLDAWRDVLESRAGKWGMTGLGFAALGVATLVSAGAGVLMGMWIAAAASLIGVLAGPSKLRELLMGWALLFIAIGFAMVAAEGVLRIPSVAQRVGTPRELLSWWQRYDGLWHRNVLGIRSPYETFRKESGVIRVVTIGDSFTWGSKIASSDSTWPAQLEDILRKRNREQRIEVVNLGKIGFSTVNSAAMLRRLGWQFDPDIVVAQFYVNDILPSGSDFGVGEMGWLFPRVSLLPERYRNGLFGSSALLHLAEDVLSGLRHGDRTKQAAKWTDVYERRGSEWLAMHDGLNEMGRGAAVRGVPIVLMLFPDFIPNLPEGADHPYAAIHGQVAQAAGAAGFSILDLTPHYARAGGDQSRWWATRYDSHPNAAADRFAAGVLADFLVDSIDPALWIRSRAGAPANGQ
jgi:hypothetical protein